MSYNVYVDIINEVYNRLNNASRDNNAFPYLFTFRFSGEEMQESFIRVGTIQTVESNDYLPSIQILWRGAEEDYSTIASGQMNGQVRLIIRVHYGLKNADEDNILFNTTDKTGILYLLEEICDVIMTNYTTGAADARLNGNARESIRFTIGDITKFSDKLMCDIEMTVGTRFFPINKRQEA